MQANLLLICAKKNLLEFIRKILERVVVFQKQYLVLLIALFH